MKTLRALVCLAFLFGALSAGAAGASEDPRLPWDQKKLEKLTDTFEKETKAIRESVIKYLPDDIEIGGDSSVEYVVFQDAAFIHKRALALNGLIRGGAGRETTEPVLRRIVVAVEHARRDAERFPPLRSAERHMQRAIQALDQIQDYY